MRDKFEDYWVALAERFHDNEYVIGFDPFNEPFPAWDGVDSFMKSFMAGGDFDLHLLGPFYEGIFMKMADKNIAMPMFFEPT